MRWTSPSPRWLARALTASLLLCAGCTLPRIIVLHDPLNADDHAALGGIYESQGKFDLALRQYREAVKQDPRNCGTLMSLGGLLYRTGDDAGAEEAYVRALKLDPENGDAKNNLAWVLVRSRRLDRAQTLIREALSINPAHRAHYLDTLGALLLKQGNPGAAVAALEEASALSGNGPELTVELKEHLDEARKAVGEEAVRRAAAGQELRKQ